MDTGNQFVKEIGHKLVEASVDSEMFSAQRGLVDELFPYIWEASSRMSSRAISRWLAQEHKIKLSAVTVARALRNAPEYWSDRIEMIEPAVRSVADAHEMTIETLLELEDEQFDHITQQPPRLLTTRHREIADAYMDYESARALLSDEWFSLPETARAECLAHNAELLRESQQSSKSKVTTTKIKL